MEKTITKIVETKKNITEQIICDVCRKVIADTEKPRAKYWRLMTCHGDWGNDSCESITYFDLCSAYCIEKKLEDYFENCERSYTQEFNLSQEQSFINLE